MKRLILLTCLILASFALTGCFGLVVAHPHQKTSSEFCLGNRGMITNGPFAIDLTAAQVLDLWGQPDSKRTGEDGLDIWRYQGKYQWGVLMPMYLLPVPIPYPAGHGYVDIYFNNGIALKASRPVGVYTGAAFAAPSNKGYMLGWEKEMEPDGTIK